MPDDRNGTPAGSTPFGRARGTNGVHSNGAPHSPVDLPTRPLPVDVADGPIDLVAVQADDELVNALGTGAVVTYGDRAPGSDPDPRRTRDERVVAMLAAWRAEIEADPIPELIDLDTAVAAVVAGVKADAAGTRQKRANRLRHLAPLAAAAAIIVAAVSGVGLGSQNAMPGDALWPVQKVVDPERAESVETKLVVESQLEAVRTDLLAGDTEAAALKLQAISAEIPEVLVEQGQQQLVQEHEFLAAKLADAQADPDKRVDLSTRPESKPSALSTTEPSSTSPSSSSSQSTVSEDPSQSKSVGPDVRREQAPSEALDSSPPPSASDSDKPSTSDSGSSSPDVTKQPDEPKPAPDNAEGSTDPSTKPAPSSGDQPVSEAGTSHPASNGAEGGTITSDTAASGTTASGSAGTKVDATGMTKTS